MLDFQTYLMRHGEHGVQAILETIEQNEKIRHAEILSLEIRWEKVMNAPARIPSALVA